MLNYQRFSTSSGETQYREDEDEHIRDIHALTPPQPSPPAANHPGRHRGTWETSLSIASEGASSENFTTISGEFSALVLAGSTTGNNGSDMSDIGTDNGDFSLARIEEEAEIPEEDTNPLALVPDNNPLPHPRRTSAISGGSVANGNHGSGGVSVHGVKRAEVEMKILAWQTAKIAKINNGFKREDTIIHGWEIAQVQKATSWMNKVERKLEEKRARALEKMQNKEAKARRTAEERRASAEARRGTKVAEVLEVANLMKAVGRAPAKRSFF